jgi:hypothetical protein
VRTRLVAQITGEKVDWLRTHGDLYVAVELNETDPDAKTINSGKAPPRLVRNIPNQSFSNAVIVDNGSVVQFKILSRGQFGFGYRTYAGLRDIRGRKRDLIADRLYCLTSEEQKKNKEIDRAYQDAEATVKPLIQILNFPSFPDISAKDHDIQVAMMSCTVVSWRVYGYIDENDEDYGIPLNIGEVQFTNVPSVSPPRWNESIKAEPLSAPITVFGGGPCRLVPSKGNPSTEFSSARLIREDNPRFAPNYVSFAFLVAP